MAQEEKSSALQVIYHVLYVTGNEREEGDFCSMTLSLLPSLVRVKMEDKQREVDGEGEEEETTPTALMPMNEKRRRSRY